MKRRNFIKSGGIISAALAAPQNIVAQNSKTDRQWQKDSEKVNFTRDGLDFTSLEYSRLLTEINGKQGIEPDSYSRGGVVEKLEKKMAEILGKESAVYMPTGTLANHIALRKLAGENRKVIVQADSHIYRDSGDCANTLSGLNLIPLGKGRVDFDLSEVEQEYARTAADRVRSPLGVISIESPVRRFHNQLFDFKKMQAISAFARKNKIKMHLDGARLFNACVHTQKSPAEFAQLFDTVYISLYKDFNAASGAILAGSKEFTNDLYHMRRMFGGGMPQVWPFAAVAFSYLDTFLEDYKTSLQQAKKLFSLLKKQSNIEIEKIENGSNVFKMKLPINRTEKFKTALAQRNVFLPSADAHDGAIYFKINPSILRQSPENLARAFSSALNQIY